ncbi:MAG TPA: class I SAM-dependent methyltransferase [Streptosporangiaceae bacterium]|jgi:Methyltransferase domain|nr:class I SAM-dependent methyltransferase [Streptosporangiaceae bacterium]
MIGRSVLPEEYLAWNETYGAPFGFFGNERYYAGQSPYTSLRDVTMTKERGLFGFQYVSHTRLWEYPWAFHAAGLRPGMSVLDIGGGTAGLQYLAALNGCAVTNADPAAQPGANEWSDDGLAERHAIVNGLFGTDVRLLPVPIQEADLPEHSFDRIFCLSVLEHVGPAEATDMMACAAGLLKPDGLMVMTVDLFLDLEPFGVLTRNHWGINHDVGDLIKHTGLDLLAGDPRELLGTPEFDRDRVVSQLPDLLVSATYPVVSQSFVLGRASR